MLSIFKAKIVERTETISTEIRSIQFNSLSDAYYRKTKQKIDEVRIHLFRSKCFYLWSKGESINIP